VHGSYFADNFGDTLLVKLMCDWIAERIGRDNVFLAVPGHSLEQESIGYPVISPEQRRSVSHLVFTGGGHFGEPALSFRRKYEWQQRNRRRHLAWLKSYRGAKKAIFGIGVGPLSNPFYRRAVRRLFLEADVIYVRDEESLLFSRQYGFNAERVRLGTDLAMSIGPAARKPEKPFALHVAELPGEEIVSILDALIDQGLAIPNEPVDVFFDSTASEKEIRRYEDRLASRLPRDTLRFIEYRGVEPLIDRISTYDLIFTSKLHVGIVATALGRKVISIPSHQKTVRFYRQLGLERFCLDKDRRHAGEISRAIAMRADYRFDRAPIRQKLQSVFAALDDFVGPGPRAAPRCPVYFA
jgi:polysaccharide pyruvyl transferase WcaK-like protein